MYHNSTGKVRALHVKRCCPLADFKTRTIVKRNTCQNENYITYRLLGLKDIFYDKLLYAPTLFYTKNL